jgi:hypothetical protein
MSLTARDCPNCAYSVFADDEHTCIVANRAVLHPKQFPTAAHWAILTFNDPKAILKAEYRAYFSEQAWKNKIKELAQNDVLFSAFKASSPAEVTTQISIDIETP